MFGDSKEIAFIWLLFFVEVLPSNLGALMIKLEKRYTFGKIYTGTL